MAAGSSSPGPASPRPGARAARPACSAGRPSHRSRQPRQAAERNRSSNRLGGRHDIERGTGRRRGRRRRCRAGTSSGGPGRWGWGAAGPGSPPAAGHGTPRLRPAPALSSSRDLDHARPWPHQRHTTSSTCREAPRPPRRRARRPPCSGGRPSSVLRDGDVEAGEVAAAVTPVSRVAHAVHGSPRAVAASSPQPLRPTTSPNSTPVDVDTLPCRRRRGAAARACSSVSKTQTDVPRSSPSMIQ